MMQGYDAEPVVLTALQLREGKDESFLFREHYLWDPQVICGERSCNASRGCARACSRNRTTASTPWTCSARRATARRALAIAGRTPADVPSIDDRRVMDGLCEPTSSSLPTHRTAAPVFSACTLARPDRQNAIRCHDRLPRAIGARS
jgi:hypothetical protein